MNDAYPRQCHRHLWRIGDEAEIETKRRTPHGGVQNEKSGADFQSAGQVSKTEEPALTQLHFLLT